MMSTELIRKLADDAAAEAAATNKTPYVFWDDAEIDQMEAFPVPFIGGYVPDDWTMEQTYFVDATGWDPNDAGGPALSVNAFKRALKDDIAQGYLQGKTIGWAVIEAGAFQVVVGRFSRLNRTAVAA